MVFEVKTRNEQGKVEFITIEADSRSAVFGELDKLGRKAISVSQLNGKAKPRRSYRAAGGGVSISSRAKGLAALLLTVIIGVVVYVSFSSHAGSNANERSSVEKPIAKTDSAAVVANDAEHLVLSNVARGSSTTSAPIADAALQKEPSAVAVTNDNGIVLERMIGADGKVHDTIKDLAPPVFSNGTDQVLAMAMSATDDCSMPPLPGLGRDDKENLVAALTTPVAISPEDPDQLRALKERVNAVKREIVDLMKQDPTVELGQLLEDHRAELNSHVELRSDAKQYLEAILSESGEEEALKFRDRVNEMLLQIGASPIDFSEEEEDE